MADFHQYLSASANFLLFLPFFFGLFLLGALKGIIVCPIALSVLSVGNSAVILGLWPVHVVWTYHSISRTKKLGPVLKLAVLFILPLPLFLWLVFGIVGSVLVGLGYGFFTPLIATFEAVREGRENKFIHCFTDGIWDTVKGSCTVVRDFTDFCYHSYLSFLNDFRTDPPQHQPYEIKLLELPFCVLAGILGVLVDVPFIALLAFAKSPVMLLKGWRRLLQDLIGREGPFLETVCVPFAGLAILLWPLAVVSAVVCAVLSSILIGLYAAVVVYQESSFKYGLAYILSVAAEFDEYTNDAIYLREGSCLPRPKYRKQGRSLSDLSTRNVNGVPKKTDSEDLPSPAPTPRSASVTSRAGSEVGSLSLRQSRSLRQTLQEVKVVQIWDNFFKACELCGKELVEAGVLKVHDLDEWSRSARSSRSRIISVGLPAYAVLHSLIRSARAGSAGILFLDGIELNRFNRPQDRMVDWLFEPLLVLKDQIKALELKESEEIYFRRWVLTSGDATLMELWQNEAIAPEEGLRKEELHALSRRIQGIATFISRFPTFRRRFQNTVRNLMLLACINKDTTFSSQTADNSTGRHLKSKAVGVGDPLSEEMTSFCVDDLSASKRGDFSVLQVEDNV